MTYVQDFFESHFRKQVSKENFLVCHLPLGQRLPL